MTAQDIEVVVAKFFDYRSNVIVPNVSWGLGLKYEADMVVLRQSDYAAEIEIKCTASDIRADLRKRHQHDSAYFRELWFAVPTRLAVHPDIPKRAGILAIDEHADHQLVARIVRRPKHRPRALRWPEAKRLKLTELGCMRIWTLKQHLSTQKARNQQKQEHEHAGAKPE